MSKKNSDPRFKQVRIVKKQQSEYNRQKEKWHRSKNSKRLKNKG